MADKLKYERRATRRYGRTSMAQRLIITHGLSERLAKAVVKDIHLCLVAALRNGQTVEFLNVGLLIPKKMPHPSTGGYVPVTVRFKQFSTLNKPDHIWKKKPKPEKRRPVRDIGLLGHLLDQ